MKTKAPELEIEPVLQFTDTQNSEENLDAPKNYSFGREVYEDFTKRKAKIKEKLDLGNIRFHMIGTIKNNKEKRKYVLETAIGFNDSLSSDLLTSINFLVNMTENPLKIFNNEKYQNDFKEAVFSLKKNKIKIKRAFSLEDKFLKKYEFDDYLFYNPEKNIIKYHEWEDKTSQYETAILKKDDIAITKPRETLLMLNEKGLIEFDYGRIVELKKQYRKKFFSLDEKKNLAYYRRIIEEEQKINHPLFLITKESSFNNVINTLEEKEILNYFPFSSRFNIEFLAYALRNKFGGEKN